MWVDSHCHLQLPTTWGPGGEPPAGTGLDEAAVAQAIARAVDAGVERMVCIGTDLETSEQAVAIAAAHPEVWATVGLHPHDASKLAGEWEALAVLARSPRVVGIGECGFDLYYRHSEPDDQEAAFRAQIRLAGDLGLALVIHSRDAWAETFGVLRSEGVPDRTVFHCFSGGPEEAEQAVDMGTSLSFSGMVSFPKADDLRAAAVLTPADQLLVETDSPFLTPVPYRGRQNEPAYVRAVGAALATARSESVEAVAESTRENAFASFWPGEG